MKLRMINEIQHKYASTNMNRANVNGVYGVGSINNLYQKDTKKQSTEEDESIDKDENKTTED